EPNNVDALYTKGLVLSLLGKYQEGIDLFDKTLEINPNHTDVLLVKDEILSMLNSTNDIN
ncbi:MAG: tetratricopeptide repeat protein, partial [Nitrososphaeraceae archaeon]